ncbi:MAG: hypothetical protein FVQ83_10405 [Chloroflexi bacterium]|nr:hypothetical protein [Chloroflexota bacterium]
MSDETPKSARTKVLDSIGTLFAIFVAVVAATFAFGKEYSTMKTDIKSNSSFALTQATFTNGQFIVLGTEVGMIRQDLNNLAFDQIGKDTELQVFLDPDDGPYSLSRPNPGWHGPLVSIAQEISESFHFASLNFKSLESDSQFDDNSYMIVIGNINNDDINALRDEYYWEGIHLLDYRDSDNTNFINYWIFAPPHLVENGYLNAIASKLDALPETFWVALETSLNQ